MKELTGRHVLYMILGFFGVVLLANVVFVYLAMDTFTGLATEGAYVKGLSYNLSKISRYSSRFAGQPRRDLTPCSTWPPSGAAATVWSTSFPSSANGTCGSSPSRGRLPSTVRSSAHG